VSIISGLRQPAHAWHSRRRAV